MIENTINPNVESEEDVQEDEQIRELESKQDATDEDRESLVELKKRKAEKTRVRISELLQDRKMARSEAEEYKRQLAETNAKIAELEKKIPAERPAIEQESIVIDGKSYYTDKALKRMVDGGQISDSDAFAHARSRDKAEIKAEVKQEMHGATQQERLKQQYNQSLLNVVKERPEFDPKHKDHNPNDPLFVEVNDLLTSGLRYDPDGPMKALKKAKRILGMSDKRPDMSENFSVHGSTPPSSREVRDKEVTLTEEQKDTAIRMYCRGDAINPKTGRAYTETEAIAKAKIAVLRQRERRESRGGVL